MDNTERYTYIRVKKRDDGVNSFLEMAYDLRWQLHLLVKEITENAIKILIDICLGKNL